MIYTAQYKYDGPDRLDITIKGAGEGLIFAPTWDMVTGHKKGLVSQEEYTDLYYRLLIARWYTDKSVFENFLHRFKTQHTTVVCFCKPNTFCHRYLLTKFLNYNYDIQYGGERVL
jgi:hypothetical protein